MKLALLYTVWIGDDMEMLKSSIMHHKDLVDAIYINYQYISNRGETAHDNKAVFWDMMREFATNYPNVFIGDFFKPDLNVNTKENERVKHNNMIQLLKNHAQTDGYTHFIMTACDHFYTPGQLEWAKEYHQSHNIDLSFTMMRTYYKHANWYLDPMEYYYMPFIHKLYPETEISKNVKYPVRVDPSVMVNTSKKFRVFTPDECLLHHYSMVRKDIERKLRNAAASIRWTPQQVETFISEYHNAKPGDQISYFQGRKIVEITK